MSDKEKKISDSAERGKKERGGQGGVGSLMRWEQKINRTRRKRQTEAGAGDDVKWHSGKMSCKAEKIKEITLSKSLDVRKWGPIYCGRQEAGLHL